MKQVSSRNTSTSEDKRPYGQMVFEELSKLITNFEIAPRTRLTERELIERFGVSRTPIREALKLLDQAGLVTQAKPNGYMVKEVDLQSVRQLYQVRAALEELVVVEVAIRRTSPEFLALKTSVDSDAMQSSFHEALVRITENCELVRILTNIYTRIQPYRLLDERSRSESVSTDHKNLMRHLASNDVEAARRIMHEHIALTQSSLDNLLSTGLHSISFNPIPMRIGSE